MEVLRSLYVCASGLRFSGRSRQEYTHSYGFLRICLSRSCRGPGGNRSRDRAIAKAGTQTTRQLPKAISRVRIAKNSSFCTSTTPIPAEGSSAHRKNKKHNASFCTSTTPIPAEGCAGTARIAKNLECASTTPIPAAASSAHRKKTMQKPRVFAPRPRRSPQRVHARTAKKKHAKTSSFCTSTALIPAEGRAGTARIAKNLECASTTPIPAEGRNPDRGSKSCPGALET